MEAVKKVRSSSSHSNNKNGKQPFLNVQAKTKNNFIQNEQGTVGNQTSHYEATISPFQFKEEDQSVQSHEAVQAKETNPTTNYVASILPIQHKEENASLGDDEQISQTNGELAPIKEEGAFQNNEMQPVSESTDKVKSAKKSSAVSEEKIDPSTSSTALGFDLTTGNKSKSTENSGKLMKEENEVKSIVSNAVNAPTSTAKNDPSQKNDENTSESTDDTNEKEPENSKETAVFEPLGTLPVALPIEQQDRTAINLETELAGFESKVAYYKSNATSVINNHITAIHKGANAQCDKVNLSAKNNSKWITASYNGSVLKIEQERKDAVLSIHDSLKKEKSKIWTTRKDQLRELDSGTLKRGNTLKSKGEKIVKSIEQNGIDEKKRIQLRRLKTYNRFTNFIDQSVKFHKVKDRETRMRLRLKGIMKEGMNGINETSDELIVQVDEETKALASRIREEYREVATSLPDEKETVRQAIIDTANAAIDQLNAIEIDPAIKELNANVASLKNKLKQEKTEILQFIENTRSATVKEIHHEEAKRVGELKHQLKEYTTGIDAVVKDLKKEIKDKPDVLAKQLIDQTIQQLKTSHNHLKADTQNGKKKLLQVLETAASKTVVIFYKTKNAVIDQNQAIVTEFQQKLPDFASKVNKEYERISDHACLEIENSVVAYLKQLDLTVTKTIDELNKEKYRGIYELKQAVNEVLYENKKIENDTIVQMNLEAYRVATEWDATYYTRVAAEGFGIFIEGLVKVVLTIIAVIIAIILAILLIVLIVYVIVEFLAAGIMQLLRALLPRLMAWLGRIITTYIRPLLARFFTWIFRYFAKFGKYLMKSKTGKYILGLLSLWGIYEGFSLIWEGISRQDLSRSERVELVSDGIFIGGTSVAAEWKVVQSLFRLSKGYKQFKALAKLVGDAKIASSLVNIAKGDLALAKAIATRMTAAELKIVLPFVDNAVDLQKALTLLGDDVSILLQLLEKTGDFTKMLQLLEGLGGNGALLARLLPKVSSADELIVLMNRVPDAKQLERLLSSNVPINSLSDDVLAAMTKMSDDELKALAGKNADEVEELVSKKDGNLVDEITGAGSLVKRIGLNKFGTTEVAISKVQKIHGVPKKGTPTNHIENLANDFKTNGYNLESGPPIEGYAMPDGQIIIIDGHHRLAALELLGETNIPIRIHPQIADEGLRKMLKIGEYSGFYPPSRYPTKFNVPDFGNSINHEIDNEALKFVQENF